MKPEAASGVRRELDVTEEPLRTSFPLTKGIVSSQPAGLMVAEYVSLLPSLSGG
jgi:hypothetical protein